MRKLNVAGVSALLALALVLGTVAATRSVSLGTTQKKASDSTLRTRTTRLDAFERSLRQALARRPPALPRIPKAPSAAQLATAAGPVPATAAATQQAAPVRVVYHRPPPRVITLHRSHGDEGDSHEHGEHEGGGDD